MVRKRGMKFTRGGVEWGAGEGRNGFPFRQLCVFATLKISPRAEEGEKGVVVRRREKRGGLALFAGAEESSRGGIGAWQHYNRCGEGLHKQIDLRSKVTDF